MKKWMAFAVLLAALAAVAAFLRFTPFALPLAQVQPAQTCAVMQAAAPAAVRWDGDRLRLQVDVTANCAVTASTFAVQRVGSTLWVRSSHEAPPVSTGCNCTRRYMLELQDLTRQDYRVLTYSWP